MISACQPVFYFIAMCQSQLATSEYAQILEQAKTALQSLPEQSTQHYAMTCLIDDVLMNSEWPGQPQWSAFPLQLQLFDEHIAGEHFYQTLDQLLQQPQQNQSLIEVFYVAINMGFSGQYRGMDNPYLARLATVIEINPPLLSEPQPSPVDGKQVLSNISFFYLMLFCLGYLLLVIFIAEWVLYIDAKQVQTNLVDAI